MASPTVQSLTPTSFGSNTTSHLVSMPATVTTDDLLLMFFTSDDLVTFTDPAGWSIVVGPTDPGGGLSAIVYGKKASGSEGSTTVDVVTSSGQEAAAHVYRITGWGGTIATDIVAGTPSAGIGSNPNPPSASWTWGSLDALAIAAQHYSTNGDPTGPSGYTNFLATNTSGSTGGAAIATAEKALTAQASPEDPPAFTDGFLAAVANTVVIKSGSAGGGGGGATVVSQFMLLGVG